MILLWAWLIADFVSGLIHWWEDRAFVGQSRFEFLNGVRADNERHHKEPTYLLKFSWWGNINTTAPLSWALSLVLFLMGAPTVIVLATFFMGFGNLIHRWSHERTSARPRIVTLIQKIGLFSSPSHHAGHHFKRGKLVMREDAQIRYCVMTNWLNPILDYINFFQFLELIFNARTRQ